MTASVCRWSWQEMWPLTRKQHVGHIDLMLGVIVGDQ